MKEPLELMVQHLGFSDEIEELSQPAIKSFSCLIQKFRDKGSRWVYETVFTQYGMQCECKEWHSRKCCRHLVYIFDRLSIRDEHGRIIGISHKVKAKPKDATVVSDFRTFNPEWEEWLAKHLEILEI